MLPRYSCKILIDLFGIEIRTWGVVQILGISLFLYLTYREAVRLKVRMRPWICMVIIGSVFAVLGMKLYNLFLVTYRGLWRSLVRLVTLKGGLDSAGGVLGIGACLWYVRTKRLNMGRYLDTVAFPGSVLNVIARIGCACALCEKGTVTSVSWGLFYEGDIRHPIALYYISSGLLVMALIYALRKRSPWDGFLITSFFFAYSFTRIILDYFREVPAHLYFGLSVHQLVYLALFIASGSLLGYRAAKDLNSKLLRK